jgi:hypothetical protein
MADREERALGDSTQTTRGSETFWRREDAGHGKFSWWNESWLGVRESFPQLAHPCSLIADISASEVRLSGSRASSLPMTGLQHGSVAAVPGDLQPQQRHRQAE